MNLDEWLIEKMKSYPTLANVPTPIIHEVVGVALAFLAELPTDHVESNPPVVLLDTLLHSSDHAVCTKCDTVVPYRGAVSEEPGSPTHIPRPTMCIACWNALAEQEGRKDDMRCTGCGTVLPCEDDGCSGDPSEIDDTLRS